MIESIKRTALISEQIKAVPNCNYVCDISFKGLQSSIDRYVEDYGRFDFNPDFQRGHVWTVDQQIKYIEAVVRGTVSKSALMITLNCTEFKHNGTPNEDSDLENGFDVVDGLQRLTAILAFTNGEFTIFSDIYENGVDIDFFNLTSFSFKSKTIKLQIFDMQYKKDLLDYYLAFNTGGMIHSDEEIQRVKDMRDKL